MTAASFSSLTSKAFYLWNCCLPDVLKKKYHMLFIKIPLNHQFLKYSEQPVWFTMTGALVFLNIVCECILK